MIWIPKFTYDDAAGAPQTLTLSLAQGEWRKHERRYGGTHVASSRIRASYTIRRDYLLTVRLRYDETERESVSAMIEALQDTGGVVHLFPDKDVATSYSAYLEAPLDEWSDEEHPGAAGGHFQTEVTFVRTTSDPWPMEYYG